MQLQVKVSSWKAWAPGLDDLGDWRRWSAEGSSVGDVVPADESALVPDVSYLPAMLRRRLSPLAKAATHVAWHCLGDAPADTPVIFSSLYGESERTLALTESVATDQPLSPASFSLSVHNAVAGQFTIARQLTSEAVCLSPAGGGVVPALLEAHGMLAEGAERVLVVYYDQPLPACYDDMQLRSPTLMACALLLTRSDCDSGFTLRREGACALESVQQDVHLHELIKVLIGATTHTCFTAFGANWHWSRCAEA